MYTQGTYTIKTLASFLVGLALFCGLLPSAASAADKVTLSHITTGQRSLQQNNADLDAIRAGFNNTLSRDGTSPNQMNANIDMNGKKIINLPAAASSAEPVTLGQLRQLSTNGLGAPIASSNADLRAISTANAKQVFRIGWATPGDSEVVSFNAGSSSCVDDGGSKVSSADGKCWLANFQGHMDVRGFGAVAGSSVDTPLSLAVAAACVNHIPMTLPYPSTPYLINSVTIGNGGLSNLSTCNDVDLSVIGSPNESHAGTTPPGYMAFKFNGSSASTIPFILQGPASHIGLHGISINCAGVTTNCNTGLKITNIIEGRYSDIGVEGNTGPCMILDTIPNNSWQGSLEGSRPQEFQCGYPGVGGGGATIGVDDCTTYCLTGPTVIANLIENWTMNWDGTTANTCGITLRFVSQVTGINIRSAPTSGSLGHPICIRPPAGANGSGFPTDVTIIHPLIDTAIQAVYVDTTNNAWTPAYGGLNIVNWSPVWQAFPTYSTNPTAITGNDALGRVYPGALNWTPTDASGASLTFTVQDATYSLNGNTCNVVLAITYPATANGSAAAISGLPSKCLPIAGSGTSRISGTIAYTTFATATTVVMSNTGTINFYAFGGGGVSNASLTGKVIRMNFAIPIN